MLSNFEWSLTKLASHDSPKHDLDRIIIFSHQTILLITEPAKWQLHGTIEGLGDQEAEPAAHLAPHSFFGPTYDFVFFILLFLIFIFSYFLFFFSLSFLLSYFLVLLFFMFLIFLNFFFLFLFSSSYFSCFVFL